jgi:hypothetical protein
MQVFRFVVVVYYFVVLISYCLALHWFTCPNGHAFTIGECGHATQAAICPECGIKIGGIDHKMPEHKATSFLNEVQKK